MAKWKLEGEIAKWGFTKMPTSAEIAEALFQDEAIEWNRLTAFQAVSARRTAERALPERHPYGPLFDGFLALLDALAAPGSHWGPVYVRWELGLLEQLGFGLDFSECAVTGGNDALVWVSPRSGRAVCASAGEPYRDKLLALPGFLAGQGEADDAQLADALDLTGYFLTHCVFHPLNREEPGARTRFVDRYRRVNTISGVSSNEDGVA